MSENKLFNISFFSASNICWVSDYNVAAVVFTNGTLIYNHLSLLINIYNIPLSEEATDKSCKKAKNQTNSSRWETTTTQHWVRFAAACCLVLCCICCAEVCHFPICWKDASCSIIAVGPILDCGFQWLWCSETGCLEAIIIKLTEMNVLNRKV